jgi:hypothetical protein
VTTFSKEDRDTAIEKATKAVEKAREGFEGSRQRFEAHVESYGRALYRLRVAELMPVEGATVAIPTPCVHDDPSKPAGVVLNIPELPVAEDVATMIEGTFTPGPPLPPVEHAVPVNPFATVPAALSIDERAEEASRAALARTAEQEKAHALAGLDEEKRARVAAALAGAAPVPPVNPFAGLV